MHAYAHINNIYTRILLHWKMKWMHVTARIDRLVHIEKGTCIHLHNYAFIYMRIRALEDEVDIRDGKDRQVSA
jgi:hypothetical protein